VKNKNFIKMENKDGNLEIKEKPVCLIVLGMAGSGKVIEIKRITLFINKFHNFFRQHS
jgi:hypothetical protein